MIKYCRQHGDTEFRSNSTIRIHFRCAKCLSEAVQKRRETIKKLSVEYKGGKCQNCGYNRCQSALHFHHLDPNEKDFSISAKGYTRSFAKVKIELDKCVLLCANCHAEEHEKLHSINTLKDV